MAKNLKLTALAAVIVHCTQPTGYRRGGISLASGKQTLSAESLTQEQLEAIENDPRLSVQVIPRDEGTASQGQLDANNVDTTVKLYEHVDYTQAPQAQTGLAVRAEAPSVVGGHAVLPTPEATARDTHGDAQTHTAQRPAQLSSGCAA